MNTQLSKILAEVFGLRETEIKPELEKGEVDTWDSLKQMDLVTSLEREYNILLEIPDIIRMTSIATIIEVLQEKGVNFED